MPLGALALSAVALVPLTQDGEGLSIEETQAAIEEWVETRRLISEEKRDWKLGEEMLNERVEVVSEEIESLRAKIEETKGSIAEADEKRIELVEENERLKEASASLQEMVTGLEARTGALLARVPESLQERVKPLSQRFPKDPADTKLSLGERFQNVVGVLNAINKFHGEVSVTSEVRKLSDGSTAEVTALYLGIGHAYYVTASGDAAGIGTAGEEGWTWTPADEHAAAIAQAVAVLKNEQEAVFVGLPIQVD